MGILDRLFGTRPQVPPPAVRGIPKSVMPAEKEAPEAAAEAAVQPPEVVEAAPKIVEEVSEIAEAAPPIAQEAPEPPKAAEAAADDGAPAWGPHLQKRLDTYFARLRAEFPDGEIVRLNTGHKKLAERGAELRRLIGWQGDLDGFFALGGFTYRRSTGGRPRLPAEQTASVEDRLREAFPEDVPTLLAVQQKDHRLYLDLRAAARAAGCTVGEYLDQFREL